MEAEITLQVEELLNRSTLRDDLPLSVNGNFSSQEEAQKLLSTVFMFAKVFGASFDLSALEAITIADDYSTALSNLDRGYPGMKAVIPTRDEFGAGFAMAVPVLRDGQHKSHVVLDSALARPLIDPSNEFYKLAVHTLCHELAHVYDHMLRVKAMPNHYGTTMTDLREVVCAQFAMAAWDEYAASRLSAPWAAEDYSATHEESLVKMSKSLLSRSEAAKKEFAKHRDVEQTMTAVRSVFETFFVRASYLIGHIDGLGQDLKEQAPTFSAFLDKSTWLKELWKSYVDLLRSMFLKLEHWSGVKEYEPLKELGEKLLLCGGMGFVKLPNGGYYVGFNPTKSI